MQPGSGLAPTPTADSIHGAMAAAASAKKGAAVDPDTLRYRRVLDMPVKGYGKHNGTVTKVHPSARRITITITFDDESKQTFNLSRVLKYLGAPTEVAAQKLADQAVVDMQDEADCSAGDSERDAPSADGEGAEASSLGFDEAQRAKEEAEPPPPLQRSERSQIVVPANSLLEWHVKQASQLQAELAAEKLQCAKLREECAALQQLSASSAHPGPIEGANEAGELAALQKQVEMLTADKLSLDRQLKEAQNQLCRQAGIAEERGKRGQDAERMVAELQRAIGAIEGATLEKERHWHAREQEWLKKQALWDADTRG
jgi:hypothetical protein